MCDWVNVERACCLRLHVPFHVHVTCMLISQCSHDWIKTSPVGQNSLPDKRKHTMLNVNKLKHINRSCLDVPLTETPKHVRLMCFCLLKFSMLSFRTSGQIVLPYGPQFYSIMVAQWNQHVTRTCIGIICGLGASPHLTLDLVWTYNKFMIQLELNKKVT